MDVECKGLEARVCMHLRSSKAASVSGAEQTKRTAIDEIRVLELGEDIVGLHKTLEGLWL